MEDWIRVSERLPDDLEEAIITYVNHDPPDYYAYCKDAPFVGFGIYYRGSWYWWSAICEDILREYGEDDTDKIDEQIEVLAWQPIPEPYY